MNPQPLPLDSFLGAFLLAFPALFSIVNPMGAALIFHEITANYTHSERQVLAAKVAIYAACILIVSLWLGGLILSFFGISLGALRIAGGLVVAASAWGLLRDPKVHEAEKAEHAKSMQGSADDVAFFPLTMPFTTGAGSMAVAVALASQRPTNSLGALWFILGISVAAVLIAAMVWLCYRWSDRVVSILGVRASRIVSRLVSFLLLCVGIQIISTGIVSLMAASIRH